MTLPTPRSVFNESDSAVTLRVEGLEWRFHVSAVTRVDRDLFITITLDGPDLCTLVVHLCDRIELGVTASEILMFACEWLLVRGTERRGYRDLADTSAVRSWSRVA